MNYNQAMNYIHNSCKFGMKLGLQRTEKLLELLGNPHKALKCIHIAGTNGKGSITAMTAEILKQAGYKVGMYTSPYIQEFEERIQINGENISHNDLAKYVSKVAIAVEELKNQGFDDATEFEIITSAMFCYFMEQRVDYAVIEVGLGGRFDSTNVITPIVSVIASISYDHMHILGDTLDKIAYEKAGIIKKNIPLILYPQEKETFDVIKKVADDNNAEIILTDKKEIISYETGKNISYQSLNIKTANDEYNIRLNLLGHHQRLNCLTVIKLIEQLNMQGLNISKAAILKGLESVKWIGRLELCSQKPLTVLDGAHNIDGITKLVDSIDNYFEYDNLILIIGILADKQIDNMLKKIAPKATKIIAVAPNSDRAADNKELAGIIEKYNKNVCAVDDYKDAYKEALSYCSDRDMLLIAGSLYLIGDMRKLITGNI